MKIWFFQGQHEVAFDNKALKSSKTFFSHLQDNFSSKTKNELKKKSRNDSSKLESNAKRFKL